MTASVRNDGRDAVRPAIALVFARSDYDGHDRETAIDRWSAEAEPANGNCIPPGGTANITWTGNVPSQYAQVLLEDDGTRSNDC